MARCVEFSAALWSRSANSSAPLSLQWTEPMATVHDEIDNWLAADLYGELSEDEQRQLHTHLVDCAACRKTHQEAKTMNKILEETLAQQKPDPAFEQRMLAFVGVIGVGGNRRCDLFGFGQQMQTFSFCICHSDLFAE